MNVWSPRCPLRGILSLASVAALLAALSLALAKGEAQTSVNKDSPEHESMRRDPLDTGYPVDLRSRPPVADLPRLIKDLGDQDFFIRREAAHTLREYRSEVLAKDAGAEVPTLIAALQSPDAGIKVTAAWILGLIGSQANAAVPNLAANLKSNDYCIQISAAWSLGRIGAAGTKVLPALITVLDYKPATDSKAFEKYFGKHELPKNEASESAEGYCLWPEADSLGLIGMTGTTLAIEAPHKNPSPLSSVATSQEFAADSIVRIADACKDDQQTGAIELLETAAKALDRNDFASEGEKVRTDILVLKSIRRGLWVDRLIDEVRKSPRASALVIGYLFVACLCLILLVKRPLLIWKINEAFTPIPKVKLPSWVGGIDISLPHLFVIGFFQYHPRVLDAWILQNIASARIQFERSTTVRQREIYVDVPVELDRKVKPGLEPADLKRVLGGNPARILIWGEGGAGKTTLACQIAKWVMSDDETIRPCAQRMLPVMIEQDLNFEIEKNKTILIEAIRGRVRELTGRDEAPSEVLTKHLLARQRVLVIVDGLSELNDATRNKIRPINPEFSANALIVTSRLEEDLESATKAVLHPLRILGNRLSSFMDSYLVQRGKRGLFDDPEFFNLCGKLSLMVSDRDTTVLLAKLYAEQSIAAKEGNQEKLPENIPDLMLEYLNQLNRKETELDDRAVHSVAKAIAWECVRQTYRPTPARTDAVLGALGGGSLAEARVRYLEQKLRLIQVLGAGKDKIKFGLDPLSEYLAGLYVLDKYGDREASWREFLARADAMPGAPAATEGFLLAVRDCCLAKRAELNVPTFVPEELARRTRIGKH